MSTSIVPFRDIRWPRLLVGTCATLIGGLGVHVFLQQTMNVPFPTGYPAHVFLEQVDQATTVFGLLLFMSWAAPTLGRLGFVARWLALFVVYAMLRESLRAALMQGVVTTEYLYPLIAAVPRLLGFLVLTLLCVLAEPRLPRVWQKVLGAAAIYALIAFVAQPLIGQLVQAPLALVAPLQHDEVYSMPYGLHVLVPAYITYIEPAAGCILCAALVSRYLELHPSTYYLRFVFLVLLLRRSLFPPFIYAGYAPGHRLTAFASAGQFSLETIALALLAALTWRAARASGTDR